MTAPLGLQGAADGRPVGRWAAVRARVLDSVARTRAVGPHFFGNFVGVTGLPREEGRSRLHLDPEPGAGSEAPVSAVAVATLADLTMSASIRAVLGRQRRLGTITMALHHLEPVVTGSLASEATAVRVELEEERGFARCDLRNQRGTVVAAMEAWFVAMATPPGQTLGPVPWELPDDVPVAPVAESELTDDERAILEACEAATRRADAAGTSVIDELVAGTWTASRGDVLRGEIPVGPAHANRGGHVQGGVLYGAAALAAQRVVAEGMYLAEGHLSFLSPADGDLLVVESRALRHGKRTSFAQSRLTVGDRLVATGEFAFHRIPAASGA